MLTFSTASTHATVIEMTIKLGEKKRHTSGTNLKRRFTRYYNGAVLELNRDSKAFSSAAFSGYRPQDARKAEEWRADALKEKGYEYRYVIAKGAGHTDGRVTRQALPGALEWLWEGYSGK